MRDNDDAKLELALYNCKTKTALPDSNKGRAVFVSGQYMKEQRARPNYATLHYDVRERLEVNWAEYIYLDMVHKLSYQGWCFKSLESCAADLGMTKRGVSKMKERLLSRGLLRKNIRGHLKVTEKYTGVAVNSVPRLQNEGVNSVPQSVNSVPSAGELSSTKNNNRNTEELQNADNVVRRGEPSPAKERLREILKQKGLLAK